MRKVQTNLIQKEDKGSKMKLNLLLIHAQDNLMTSMFAKDIIEEMIDLYKIK